MNKIGNLVIIFSSLFLYSCSNSYCVEKPFLSKINKISIKESKINSFSVRNERETFGTHKYNDQNDIDYLSSKLYELSNNSSFFIGQTLKNNEIGTGGSYISLKFEDSSLVIADMIFIGEKCVNYSVKDNEEIKGTGYFLWIADSDYSLIECDEVDDISNYEFYMKLSSKEEYDIYSNLISKYAPEE